jgi:O-antigen/teichoic acid export membrane protein
MFRARWFVGVTLTLTATAILAFPAMADYRLGVGDVIEFSAAGVPELKQRSRVDSQGEVSFPLVGQVEAAGRPLSEVRMLDAARSRVLLGLAPSKEVYVNVTFMLLGAALGQGSLFIAQSWLIVTGKAEFLGQFAILFLASTLAYQIADWGGMPILARAAASRSSPREETELEALLASVIVTRAGVSLILFCAEIGFFLHSSDPFAAQYILWSSFGLLLWPMNTAGILDGEGQTGLSAFTSALPLAASGGALGLVQGLSDAAAGAVLGSAYSAGSIICVAAQIALRRTNFCWSVVLVQRPRWGWFLRVGGTIALGTIPGQLFYRAQVYVAAVIGPDVAGFVAYTKQIVNAFGQLGGFFRRAEFPSLVKELEQHVSVSRMFRVQAQGIAFSAVSCLLLLVSSELFASHWPGGVRITILFFAPVIITNALLLILYQGLLALGRYEVAAAIVSGIAVLGALLSVVGAWYFGLAGLALAEMATHIVGVILCFRYVRSLRRCSPALASEQACRRP